MVEGCIWQKHIQNSVWMTSLQAKHRPDSDAIMLSTKLKCLQVNGIFRQSLNLLAQWV